MTTCTYASYLLTPPSDGFTLTAVSGGTTTTSTNLYYFVYAITRGGISLGRSLGQIAIAAGQKLRLTVGTSARPTGLDPLGFALGAATTNNEVNSKLLAVCWVKESDQITNKSLPLNFDLTKDQDFILGGTVANYAALPGSSPVNGMIRYVAAESTFYQYDADGFYSDNLIVDWKKVYGWDLYLPNTTTLRSGQKWKGGQDVPINRFEITNDQTADYYGIISPIWGGEGEPSPPQRIWLTNGLSDGSGEIIESGSKLSVVAKINDDTELGSATMSSNVILSPIGKIRRSTGEISLLSGSLVWVSGNPFYTLPSDLEPGYAIEFSYITTASVGSGDRVSIHIRNDGPYGNPTNNTALGSCIYADDDKCRIVPNTLGIKRLSGKGTIATNGQLGGFEFNTTVTSGLTFGIEPDTSGQKIGISGIQNGAIACYQPGEDLPITSALRAIISTEAGTVTASSWSSPVTVGANGRIEFTIVLPSAIRSNYPDTRIAGSTQGVRNIPEMRVFVRKSGAITELSSITVESDNDQLIIISDLSGGSVVGSLPTNGSPSFNLWPYGSITGNVTGVGSLTAGSYELAIAWHYPSPNLSPTKISHDPNDGCIVELKYSFAEAIELAGYFSTIQLRGTAQTQREILNLDSRLFNIVDDPSGDRLTATLPGVPRVFVSEDAPTVDNDSSEGFEAGDFWLKSTDDPVSVYILVDATVVGEADWQPSGGGGSGQGIASVADLATLKAQTGMVDNATYLLKANATSGLNNNIYRYDLASTATGDDNTVIVPTNNTGRYLKVGKVKTTELVQTGDSLLVTAAEKAKIGNLPLDTNTSLAGKLAKPSGLPTTGEIKTIQINDNGDVSYANLPTSAYATSSQSITVPNTAQTRSISVSTGSTAWISENQILLFSDGTNSAYLKVTLISSSALFTVTGTDGRGNIVGQTLNSGPVTNGLKFVTGDRGIDGTSPIAKSSQSFTIPSVGNTANLVLTSANSSALFPIGLGVTVTDGTITAWLKVSDIPSPGTLALLRESGITNPSGTLNNGAVTDGITVTSGYRGGDGSVSATTSLTFSSQISEPSTGASENSVFIDSVDGQLTLRPPSDGTKKKFAFIADILTKVLTGFSASTATAIASSDTILEAFQKAQKYFNDWLTTFNTANKLVQLDNTGLIPTNLYNAGSGSPTTNASDLTSGTLADARLSNNVTLEGNTFNTANKLVKLNGSGLIPTDLYSSGSIIFLTNNYNLTVNKEYWNKTTSIAVNLPETSLTNQDVIKISNILTTGNLTVQNSFDSLVISGLSINYLIYLSSSNNWKIYDNTLTLIKTLNNSSTGATLTFSSFGDTNGLFYYLGTNGGTVSWTNPCPAKVAITNSGAIGTTNAQYYTDRNLNNLTPSGNQSGIHETFELLTGINFTLKRYTLQFIISAGDDRPLRWEMSGSNNGSSWTVLHTQNTNYDWIGNSYNYLSPLLTGNTTNYNYYKLAMIGNDSGGSSRMQFGEIEFYGELT